MQRRCRPKTVLADVAQRPLGPRGRLQAPHAAMTVGLCQVGGDEEIEDRHGAGRGGSVEQGDSICSVNALLDAGGPINIHLPFLNSCLLLLPVGLSLLGTGCVPCAFHASPEALTREVCGVVRKPRPLQQLTGREGPCQLAEVTAESNFGILRCLPTGLALQTQRQAATYTKSDEGVPAELLEVCRAPQAADREGELRSPSVGDALLQRRQHALCAATAAGRLGSTLVVEEVEAVHAAAAIVVKKARRKQLLQVPACNLPRNREWQSLRQNVMLWPHRRRHMLGREPAQGRFRHGRRPGCVHSHNGHAQCDEATSKGGHSDGGQQGAGGQREPVFGLRELDAEAPDLDLVVAAAQQRDLAVLRLCPREVAGQVAPPQLRMIQKAPRRQLGLPSVAFADLSSADGQLSDLARSGVRRADYVRRVVRPPVVRLVRFVGRLVDDHEEAVAGEGRSDERGLVFQAP
mmetsp:Transcript_11438/g.40660  ORF Transcript_11438/g.40660 Transcript_11438/m.40660 type:complete len:462 (+) Transcript_11438:585-1970(+)